MHINLTCTSIISTIANLIGMGTIPETKIYAMKVISILIGFFDWIGFDQTRKFVGICT